MRPILRKVDISMDHSFSIREDIIPYLYNHWHYHPEIELTLIRKGKGMRLVGDSMERFQDGDLILLGENIPHLWRSDSVYLEKKSKLQCEAIAIHFLPQCFGGAFFDLPEFKMIRSVLFTAKRGLRITGRTKKLITEKMEQILVAQKAKRIILLLDILDQIADSKSYKMLSSAGFTRSYDVMNTERISLIYTYTLNNFQNRITIRDVAAAAHISPNSFCRYFKTRTLKTYWEFLIQLRIGYACKLIIENNTNLSAVCKECGFNNLSNFNRYFKRIVRKTPLQYKREYEKINFEK